MPVDDELVAKSIVTKLIKYEKVINVPNSMSVLSDLLPVAIDMILKRKTGTYNFVNPGVISHNEILNLYKKVSSHPEFVFSLSLTIATVCGARVQLVKLFRRRTKQDIAIKEIEYASRYSEASA